MACVVPPDASKAIRHVLFVFALSLRGYMAVVVCICLTPTRLYGICFVLFRLMPPRLYGVCCLCSPDASVAIWLVCRVFFLMPVWLYGLLVVCFA